MKTEFFVVGLLASLLFVGNGLPTTLFDLSEGQDSDRASHFLKGGSDKDKDKDKDKKDDKDKDKDKPKPLGRPVRCFDSRDIR